MTELLDDRIRESILAEIRPTEYEIQKQSELMVKIIEALKKYEDSKWKAACIQAEGSTGKKQTQLKGASDLDIFVVLKPEDYPDVLSKDTKSRGEAVDKTMEEIVSEWFTPAMKKLQPESMQKTYSQHPYLSVRLEDYEVDIVACFEVSAQELMISGPISAMDRTIHHSEFVNLHLNNQTRDDVRILKSFARASHAYGDTCAVGRMGFTGYALELLVIHTGGFQQALRAITNLEAAPLDPRGRSTSQLKDEPAFRDDYVFIIDPTDSKRNVASSFDRRAVKLLRIVAEKLLQEIAKGDKERVKEMIIEKPIPAKAPPNWFLEHSLVFEFEGEKSLHYTILRDKLYSLGRLIATHLQNEQTGEPRFGLTIFEVYFEGNLYSLALLLERKEIATTYQYRGPPLSLPDAVEEFKRVHPETVEKEGHIWTTRTREFTAAAELAETLIEQHGIEGLNRKEPEETSTKLLSVMHDYVLLAEDDFLMKVGFNPNKLRK